ncbi:MAG: alpha-1,4-glucan--maltose-1-phosphate maltosyltransferase [Elusimicrobia bacterium]|nr:alpha-1,4-glucan--maltose-1-phosphate maltosyltransferase [Elusimicrobiota bacterium]
MPKKSEKTVKRAAAVKNISAEKPGLALSAPGESEPLRPETQAGRVVIENVRPEIDGGRFPIKRAAGEEVCVEADIFADGHDELVCELLWRKDNETAWKRIPMRPLGNDRWRAEFTAAELGEYRYTVQGRVDCFLTWLRDLKKRLEAAQDARLELPAGAELVAAAAARAAGVQKDARRLAALARDLGTDGEPGEKAARLADPELTGLVSRWGGDDELVRYEKELEVWVDPVHARFGAWYEVFPRSCSPEPGRHGTFNDLIAQLPYISGMGFDVLYLPPIHPVGKTHRKGANNSLKAGPKDPGSPWAIGDKTGGHKAVNPELGTLEDFRRLAKAAKSHGMDIALDVALQCSPDHSWLREHPEWFRRRPDGSLRYAENPPKKYEDIYPLDFCCLDRRPLWDEVKSIFKFWLDQGVRIFRVDNPHTKPFAFWEWLIRDLRRENPDLILLAEAFTRPRVMYRLAKAGFNQSYNYFPWRNSKRELESYFTELTRTEAGEFFRPNLWVNTPDILTEYLQFGARPAFMTRYALAATLGASCGVYGPAFELCERAPREAGREEYLDSEKYEIKHWNLDRPDSIRDFIARVNRIRRENPALQNDASLRFFPLDNEQLICYGKQAGDDFVLVVVNLDPHYKQSGWVELPLAELGLSQNKRYQMHDLLTDRRYLWQGPRNYVELDPRACPAHLFRLRRYARTEQDFDYFL